MTTAGSTPASRSDLPGLQAERTGLAWERTAIALFGNGVLLVLRHVGSEGKIGIVVASVALLAAGVVAVLGIVRSRRISRRIGTVTRARWSIVVCGAAVLSLGAAVIAIEIDRLIRP